MFSEKDFERLWFLYKTEGEPKGVSINSFCISNNIPYTAFYDWFKKTQKKVVPVEVEGIPEELIQSGNEEQHDVAKDKPKVRMIHYERNAYYLHEKSFIKGYKFMKIERKDDVTVPGHKHYGKHALVSHVQPLPDVNTSIQGGKEPSVGYGLEHFCPEPSELGRQRCHAAEQADTCPQEDCPSGRCQSLSPFVS